MSEYPDIGTREELQFMGIDITPKLWKIFLKNYRKERQLQQRRKYCFHHDIGGNPANTKPAVSWIKQEIIDLGRRKMFWCDPEEGGCGKTWII